jgi:hypothetical protein
MLKSNVRVALAGSLTKLSRKSAPVLNGNSGDALRDCPKDGSCFPSVRPNWVRRRRNSGSLFIGQQKVMPEFKHGSPIPYALGVAPFALMIFWTIRVRLTEWYRSAAVGA